LILSLKINSWKSRFSNYVFSLLPSWDELNEIQGRILLWVL
jgi:hypothetical protein